MSEKERINKKLFDFIKKSPTACHAAQNAALRLEDEGYTELFEGDRWEIRGGNKYFVRRGFSSLIAFKVPEDEFSSFMISASHSDSPAFKIKENAELPERGGAVRLSAERYGGMLAQTWMDRPLSAAGRAVVHSAEGAEVRLFDLGINQAIIPSVAVHLNRGSGDGAKLDAATDLLPLYRTEEGAPSFASAVAAAVGADEGDVLGSDVFLYVTEEGYQWNGFISAPRLDDLQCAFASLEAFLISKGGKGCPVYCLFDNEEVGSETKQGAASTFLFDTLFRLCRAVGRGEDFERLISSSFMASCDNAHAVHPNHPELCDANHSVKMNGGVVIKYNANQRYATDAVSSALFRLICEEAGVPVQLYANRADMPGGSTLGSIADTKVSLCTVDIGLAQLAMHSAFETAGADDTEYMIRALKSFFSSSLYCRGGEFRLIKDED